MAASPAPPAVSVRDRTAALMRACIEAARQGEMDEAAVAFPKAVEVDPTDAEAAVAALKRAGLQPVRDETRHAVTTPVERSAELAVVVRALDEVGIEVGELALTEPTLDDVYLTLAAAA